MAGGGHEAPEAQGETVMPATIQAHAGGLGFLEVLFWAALIVLFVPRLRYAVASTAMPMMRQAFSRLRETASTAVASRPGDDPAMRILRERFARGEIDRAEFEARREVLQGPTPTRVRPNVPGGGDPTSGPPNVV